MKVLVCGGAGYIGSHTCVALAARGHVPVVFDNLCNASAEAVRRVSALVGFEPRLMRGDVRDAARTIPRSMTPSRYDGAHRTNCAEPSPRSVAPRRGRGLFMVAAEDARSSSRIPA